MSVDRRSQPWRIPCLAGCGLSIVAVFLSSQWLRGRIEQFADLSQNPPASVFKRIFGIAPPPGVSDIRAAGYAAFNGEGWMRFHAEDVETVLRALKANEPKALVGPDDKYKGWEVEPIVYQLADARVVGWEGLKHAKKLEYYHFPEVTNSGWAGVVVVDRHRKLFFVSAVIY